MPEWMYQAGDFRLLIEMIYPLLPALVVLFVLGLIFGRGSVRVGSVLVTAASLGWFVGVATGWMTETVTEALLAAVVPLAVGFFGWAKVGTLSRNSDQRVATVMLSADGGSEPPTDNAVAVLAAWCIALLCLAALAGLGWGEALEERRAPACPAETLALNDTLRQNITALAAQAATPGFTAQQAAALQHMLGQIAADCP